MNLLQKESSLNGDELEINLWWRVKRAAEGQSSDICLDKS